MGIREALDRNKVIWLSLGVLIVVGVSVYVWRIGTSDEGSYASGQNKAWFTTDDGKTWFADDATKLPPFDKDGKTALGCVVWTADNGKVKWVSHVYRYSDAAKRSIAEAQQRLSKLGGPLPPQSGLMEVKKPGTGNTGWVSAMDQQGMAIQTPKSPSGEHEPEPLLP